MFAILRQDVPELARVRLAATKIKAKSLETLVEI